MAKIPLRTLFSLIQKRFLQSKSTLSSSKPSPLKAASSLSKPLQIDTPNSSALFNCLKSHGFDDTHIAKLVRMHPRVLNCKVNEKLEPKLHFLIQKGFTGEHLPNLILSNPMIIFRSLDSHIKPTFEILSPFLNAEEMMVAFRRSSWLLSYNVNRAMKPNVGLLISEGIPVSRIAKLLIWQPRVISQSRDRMAYAVKTVKELGFKPKENRFIHALRAICSMKEWNWKKRLELFMSLGWSKEQVLNTFRKDPLCLVCSEKKLRCSMDFYVNTMKLDPNTIIAYPKLLLYSVDTRVHPRYKVLKVLESMKLIKEDRKIAWLITMTEKKFLEEYVTKNMDKVPGLLDMYHSSIKQMKSTRATKEKTDVKSVYSTM